MNWRALLLLVALAWGAANAAPAPTADETVRTAPVTVAGAPRSLVTLVVAVPAGIEDAERLRFEVLPSGLVDVMGKLAGEIEPSSGGRRRPVFLTLRIPSDALVGLLDVADVIFEAADGRVYEVPIVLRVPAVRALRVEGVAELTDLERGDEIALSYRVRNLGNADERLQLRLVPPRGWRGELPMQTVVVPAYGESEVVAALRVPLTSGAGDHPSRLLALRVDAAGDTSLVAEARSTLRVRDLEPKLPGLVLRPTVGVVASRGGSLVAGGLALEGPLKDDIRLRVQYSPARQAQGNSGLGLAALGGLFVPFGASLEAPTWRGDLGTLQASLGDLAGLGFVMDGARATVRRGGTEVLAFAGRPTAQLRADGLMVGAGLWRPIGRGRGGITLSSLREERPDLAAFSRSLTSLGAEYEAAPMGAHQFSGGLALRSSEAESGLGLNARWEWSQGRNTARAALLHAPGGSRGFALATTQFDAAVRRSVSDRLSLDAQVLLSRDDGSAQREFSRWAAAAGARYDLSARTTLAARFADADADVQVLGAGAQAFGSRQRMLSASLETRRGKWNLASDVGAGQTIRRSTLFSGAQSVRGAEQLSLELRAGRRIEEWGNVSLGTQLQQSGPGVGLARHTRTAFARWSEVPMLLRGVLLRASTEARYIDSEFQRGLLHLSARVATTLRNGTEIAAVAERNPFIRDARGREVLVFGLRVSASTEVLAAGRLSSPGIVFDDRNGNGVREAGESGIGGVTLTHGRVRFTTNRDGEYRVPSHIRGDVRIEPSTLPRGYVVHALSREATAERRDFALVPTVELAVQYVAATDSSGRVPSGDLGLLDAWLLAEDGTEWVGRAVGAGRFVFEALPVGIYELRTGQGRLAEPVVVQPVPMVVTPVSATEIEVPVYARGVRVITPPRGNGGRGGVAPRGAGSRRVAPRGAAPEAPADQAEGRTP